jgi:fumarylacetoacetase
MNETHDPALRSWVKSADPWARDFPIQNLPWTVFRRKGWTEPFRCGVGIADQILDLRGAHTWPSAEDLQDYPDLERALESLSSPTLNELMGLGPQTWSQLRLWLSRALRIGSPLQAKLRQHLVPQNAVDYALPATIGDYTDFYTSIHHATAVGKLLRPDNPLLPNYKWIPIGYHGRASSILISGQDFRRPTGQRLQAGRPDPTTGPSERLDYEVELGVWVGTGNALGEPIAVADAETHLFGLSLLNDWSARDLQSWEYQPLGPFLGKSFATTVSPWIVTLEALEPFRTDWRRDASDPQPLEYLHRGLDLTRAGLDIQLEAWLETPLMRVAAEPPARLSRSNFKHSYWTIAQLVAHHTSNGCNLRPGDLLGTGTQSGPSPAEAGSLLELTRGGQTAINLPNGESRRFLEDGDRVFLRGHCERADYARIGFGEASGKVLAARRIPGETDRP